MHILAELIMNNEGFLLKRTLAYARQHNYVKFTTTLAEARNVSIQGLSEALLTALKTYENVPELNIDEDYSLDQIATYGILQARRHRYRGVNLEMFLGMTIYYRQGYLDLVMESDFPETAKNKYLLFILRFFDRLEIAFIREWTSESKELLLEQLQLSNRNITNEKNKYLTIFESMPTPVIILNQDNIIDNLNLSAVEYLQGTATGTAYYSKNKSRCRIEQLFPWLAEELNRFMEDDSVRTKIEKDINFNEKGLRTILISFMRMLDVSEKFKGIVIMFTDITEVKQMEAAMSRLDRLHLVGEMAASIGHELRNPMTTVRGYLQILGERDEYLTDKDSFDLMIEELDRANSIITEFLSLAKNKMVKLERNNLDEIVMSIFPLIQAQAMAQDMTIELGLCQAPDLYVDDKEIRQLILNLVCNGLEAMAPGGTLRIETSVRDGEIVLAIRDQGRGVEPAILEKLGTPFLTTKSDGTGLGLAVCYGIASRHNARIDVDTSESGTTFTIAFPINKK
ncbi:signal transduction histidine kinase, nitrogen specific, ntrb [hydrocarbon metagenome]|uniref:Signal transduction histidine kinase, nitrogen specific, ntrb n=1 Tax=hydrocarbon metagenome TaxID=938273 RepID=A0A0W8E5S0_9ZZZZ